MLSIRKIVNNFIRKPNIKPYILKEKTEKIRIGRYIPTHWVVPEGTDSFTIVRIAKNGEENFEKKITTFFNGDKIISRCTDINNVPIESREFRYIQNETTHQNISGFKRNIITNMYNGEAYSPKMKSYEVQTIIKDAKNKYARVRIEKNIFDGDNIIGIIKECLNKNIRSRHGNKLIKLNMKLMNGIPKIENQTTSNATLPEKKPLLPFVFIFEPIRKVESLARYFLKQKGLEDMKINIKTLDLKDDSTFGYFSPKGRAIRFNSAIKLNAADVSAHEVEHAYQHALIGQLGKGISEYERDCYKAFGDIKDIKLSQEATDYYIASENYPEDIIKQHTEYWNNLLEVKAREAGEKAAKEYENVNTLTIRQFNYGFKS